MSHAPAADVQQGIVYGFERDCVEKIEPAFLGRSEIQDMILRAAGLGRIEPPTVRYQGDFAWPCLADIRAWQLTLNDWGRTPTTVLHEMAHLITFSQPRGREEMARGQAHGPVFVRNAINLYSAFIGLRRSVLEQRAREFGIVVAPDLVSDAPPISGSFYDEEF